MKRIVTALAISAVLAVSCSKEDGGYDYSQAIVTVKGTESDKCFLQVNDTLVLVPTNMERNPFDKQVRALVTYVDQGYTNGPDASMKYRAADLYQIDSILTKKPVQTICDEQDSILFGANPIGIYNSWATTVEDGYITLHTAALWGEYGMPHTIDLVKGVDSKDPLLFVLRHNYCNDHMASYGQYKDALVAFDIRDILSEQDSKTYLIKIFYKSLKEEWVYGNFMYTPGKTASIFYDSSVYYKPIGQ